MGKYRGRKSEPFVRLQKRLLQSADWGALSLSERQVLIGFVASFNGHAPMLHVPYSAAPVSKKAFTRAKARLVEKQWLVLVEPGGLPHNCSLYHIGPKGARWWPEMNHY